MLDGAHAFDVSEHLRRTRLNDYVRRDLPALPEFARIHGCGAIDGHSTLAAFAGRVFRGDRAALGCRQPRQVAEMPPNTRAIRNRGLLFLMTRRCLALTDALIDMDLPRIMIAFAARTHRLQVICHRFSP